MARIKNSSQGGTLKIWICLMVFLTIVGGILAFFIGRSLTLTLCQGANIFSGGLDFIAFSKKILASTYIEYGDPRVLGACAVAFIVPFAFGLVNISRMMKGNFDTGNEHGKDRLATEKEAGSLRDHKFFFNNFLHTQLSGLPLSGWNKKLQKAQDAKNFNSICIGISGLGKTFKLSKPNILQSTGVAVDYVWCGWLNVFEHFEYSVTNSRLLSSIPLLPQVSRALANAKRGYDKVKMDRLRKRAEKLGIGEGFDAVVSDPKGDNVRDMGWLHEKAGQKVKVFDLVDPDKSHGYNPLSYIRTEDVEIVDLNNISFEVSGYLANNECPHYPINMRQTTLTVDNPHSVSGLNTKRYKMTADLLHEYVDAGIIAKKREELNGYLMAGAFEGESCEDDVRFLVNASHASIEDLDFYLKQAIQKDMPEGWDCSKTLEAALVEGNLGSNKLTVRIRIESRHDQGQSGRVAVKISDGFIVDNLICGRALNFSPSDTLQNTERIYLDNESSEVVWEWSDLSEAGESVVEGSYPMIECLVEGHLATMRVPNGVDLTKTVNTLVNNLGGTEAPANNQDPFWEDAKRLCFMSLISYLFEAYEEKYRNLPQMIELLDDVMPNNGDPSAPSRVRSMMDIWEYGEYNSNDNAAGENDMRSIFTRKTTKTPQGPHPRSRSLAVHCFRAFANAAPDTVRSIVISCQAALVNALSPQIKRILEYDELEIDTLGDPDQKQVLYLIINDNDATFAFLTSLLVQQAIELNMTKAYKKYGGKLPRHVHLELDELKNIGKIPSLVQASATVRSRNMSIAMYYQSESQVKEQYGENGAKTLFDNCSTWFFLGAQYAETLKMISDKLGNETVYSRIFTHSYNNGGTSTSEQIQGSQRALKSAAELNCMPSDMMISFVYGSHPIYDQKIDTRSHPLYAYIDGVDQSKLKRGDVRKRSLREPIPRFPVRFDYTKDIGSLSEEAS